MFNVFSVIRRPIKLKNAILLLSFILILTSSKKAVAQTESIGKKYYAYAHFYSEEDNTEYISSVFCWIYTGPHNFPSYPNDTLTVWARSNFKDALPKAKLKGYVCRFAADSIGFYNAEEAFNSWNMEMKELNNQSIAVVIVTFPPCKEK